MRPVLILFLALLVSAGMIAGSIDRCTDDCPDDLVLADVGGEVTYTAAVHSDHRDTDDEVPCSPLCPDCARPAVVVVPAIAMAATLIEVGAIDSFTNVSVHSSPSPRGLFRPPRA